MFLIEIGLVEEHEQAAQNIVVLDLLIVGDPAVAETLQNEADAVHLAVGSGGAAEGPAQSVGTDEVGHHLDVLLGVGAERRQLAVADAVVGVQLQCGADEHEAHHAIQIEITTESLGGVVEEAGRAGLVDAVDHALDEARGFVLLGKAEAETGDRFGDVERLPVIVVVAAVEQGLVDSLLGFFDETLPNGIALLGGAEREETERGVGQAVFRSGLGEHLRGDAARGEVDQIVTLEGGLTSSAIELSKGKGDMTGFIRARLLRVGG